MDIQPFSCTRPNPDRITDALVAGPDALADSSLFTLDASRALYVIEHAGVAGATMGLACCIPVDEMAGLMPTDEAAPRDSGKVASSSEQAVEAGVSEGATRDDISIGQDASALLDEIKRLGAQVHPVRLLHAGNFALDIILGAAKTATPLYALDGPSGQRLTVWRVSRPEAIDALKATYGTLGLSLATSADALVAEADIALAREHHAAVKTQGIPAPSDIALAVLIPQNQAGADTFSIPAGLLMHRIR